MSARRVKRPTRLAIAFRVVVLIIAAATLANTAAYVATPAQHRPDWLIGEVLTLAAMTALVSFIAIVIWTVNGIDTIGTRKRHIKRN